MALQEPPDCTCNMHGHLIPFNSVRLSLAAIVCVIL